MVNYVFLRKQVLASNWQKDLGDTIGSAWYQQSASFVSRSIGWICVMVKEAIYDQALHMMDDEDSKEI